MPKCPVSLRDPGPCGFQHSTAVEVAVFFYSLWKNPCSRAPVHPQGQRQLSKSGAEELTQGHLPFPRGWEWAHKEKMTALKEDVAHTPGQKEETSPPSGEMGLPPNRLKASQIHEESGGQALGRKGSSRDSWGGWPKPQSEALLSLARGIQLLF